MRQPCRDGKKVGAINIADLSADQRKAVYVDKDVPAGTHIYAVVMAYADGDAEVLAPKSEVTDIQVEDTFALPFFDDFDSASLTTNYWQTVREYGELDYQSFGFGMWMGLNSSYDLHIPIDQNKPYSFYLLSRHFDASNENHVYLSFGKRWQSLNGSAGQPLDKDFMTIEVSTDEGENWEVVSDISARSYDEAGLWSFEYYDISDKVAGKVFQLRIHPHGEAVAQTSWSLDWFKVGTDTEYRDRHDIKGLDAGYVDRDNVKLMWKNSVGGYSLTYLSSTYINGNIHSLGDEGKPFIAACSYTPKELAPYHDKYLTAVTAYINHDPSIQYSSLPHASVMVFQDNQLLCEQEFDVVVNDDNIIRLDNPIKINAGKELKIAVKIFDYDDRQWPLTYQNGMLSFVKNRSDLYSQDGGKTWKSLDDFYHTIAGQEDSGKAAWEIVGNITDNPDDEIQPYIDPELFGYSVYKNGENITPLFTWWQSPFLITQMPQAGDKFQVYGFHKDGRLIASDVFTFNGVSSVGEINGDRQDISFNRANDRLSFGPDVTSAVLYDMQGRKRAQSTAGMISTAGLPQGVYVVTFTSADGKTGMTKILK